MATKDDVKRPPQRKLTLSKETIRDLTPRSGTADALRGGARRSGQPNCTHGAGQDYASCGH